MVAKKTESEESREARWSRISIVVKGVQPIIFNNPQSMEDPEMKSADPKTQAEKRLYKNDDGKIGLPMANFFACLVNAGTMESVTLNGKKAKITVGGRTKSKTTERSTILPGLLRVEGQFIVFDPCSSWAVDKRLTRNPQTGGRNMTYRPRIDDWGFTVTIRHDENLLGRENLVRLIGTAGRWFGLGEKRADKGGEFGQFEVAGHQDLSGTA